MFHLLQNSEFHPFELIHNEKLQHLAHGYQQEIIHFKQKSHTNILPIGEIRHGSARHRALLFKYLCDHITPAIPCAVVRGYRNGAIRHGTCI